MCTVVRFKLELCGLVTIPRPQSFKHVSLLPRTDSGQFASDRNKVCRRRNYIKIVDGGTI
jgi:hypothetical protein